MANHDHLKKLKEGVEAWNRWRKENPDVRPDLREAEIRQLDLKEANLSEADLSEAYIRWADLCCVNLNSADLRGAVLNDVNLQEANLSSANLNYASLKGANLRNSNFREASFVNADLSGANLSEADLSLANLWGTILIWAIFKGTNLEQSSLANTLFGGANSNLGSAKGLDNLMHLGPSILDIETIRASEGKLPDKFLRGCGLSPWEIEFTRLYNPDLSYSEIDEILATKIYQKRADGPLYIGGVFISYSHQDGAFVDKLHNELESAGVPAWVDKHNMLAGNIEKQVMRQIRIKDIDFSAWETEEDFRKQFDKLIRGMEINY